MKSSLERYDQRFGNYLNRVIPPLPRVLQDAQKQYEWELSALFHLYLAGNFVIEEERALDNCPSDAESLKAVFVRTVRQANAIRACLGAGEPIAGAELLRSLHESRVTVAFILKENVSQRLRLYSNYRHVQQWLRLQVWRGDLESGKVTRAEFDQHLPKERIEEISRNYAAVKEDYHPKHPYHWAFKEFPERAKKGRNPTIQDLEECAGLRDREFYSVLSAITHPSPLIENLMGNACGLSSAPSFTPLIPTVTGLAADYVTAIWSDILECVNGKDSDDLRLWLRAFGCHIMEHTNRGKMGELVQRVVQPELIAPKSRQEAHWRMRSDRTEHHGLA